MHPKTLKLFRAWAKAMEEGAIVGNPDYGKKSYRGTHRKGRTGANTHPRRMRKRRKRWNRRNRRMRGE